MNIPSEDIKDMLVAESTFDFTFNTNLFIGRMPAKPKNVIVIIDYHGYPPDLGLDSVGYERPNVQIVVRNTDYSVGLSLAQDIKDSLHGRAQQTWNGTLYSVITCLGSPAPLGWDENGLTSFSINFNLQRRAV